MQAQHECRHAERKGSIGQGLIIGLLCATVLSDGLRVGIKSLMATARVPGLKYRRVSSQQGLGSTGGQDWGELYSSLWPS